MYRKAISVLLALLLLPFAFVQAESMPAITVGPSHIIPGEQMHIFFTIEKAGTVSLVAKDASGTVCATLLDNFEAVAGGNELTWDGMSEGQALAPGLYTLYLTKGENTVDMEVTIEDGSAAAAPPDSSASTHASILDVGETLPEEQSEEITKEATGARDMTPAYMSTHTPGHDPLGCYWCTPMDVKDEAAVWAMLTAPVTILDGDSQKQQIIVRKEPSEESEGVGVVTCTSQSVHVLEDAGNGWTLIETYSSSFHDSKVQAWNAFVTGYVPTKKLRTKKVNTEYGLIIDKLNQELYIFKDGRLFTTLLISTGLYNDTQPYNETRSGEFIFVSRVGEFASDNMFCSMAIRFNSGDLLHEVPHLKNADQTKNYKNTEYKLGTRASHGCIRTQRLRNAEGVNMTWIWNNIKLGTKMVIWEDYAGRQMDIPDPSTPLYYNTNSGTSYHSTAECPGVRDEYLPLKGTFTYGELEDASYKDLKACANCIPPRRVAEIEEINNIHLTQSPGVLPQVPPAPKK